MTAREAIDEMFDRYADDVYRFALYAVGNRTDAKDIVQEVFLRAYLGWDNFRQDANEKTWLFHIARNYISDFFRRKRTRREAPHEEPPEQIAAEDGELSIELRDAIARLRPDDRQVISLRLIDDVSVNDAAKILGWSAAKVRTTQHRALQRLREVWNMDVTGFPTISSKGR